jgi:hypothetical protein
MSLSTELPFHGVALQQRVGPAGRVAAAGRRFDDPFALSWFTTDRLF